MATPPRASKKEIASWALFDAANSAFPLVMVTAVFVLYFKGVVVGGDDVGRGDFLWGICVSASAALVALSSPLMGALADKLQWRKRLLAIYTVVAIAATVGLSQAGAGMIAFTMALFIIANAGFEGGMVFYGSLLPSIAPPEKMGKISGIGWACGYIGGLLCLFGCTTLITPENFADVVPTIVLIVAGWFAVFSLPLFVVVKERQEPQKTEGGALESLKRTLRDSFAQRDLKRFLIAYFLFNDAVITTFAFAGPFAADELGFETGGIIKLVMGVQLTGAIGAFGLGMVSQKIGNARTIVITLVMWLVISLIGFATAMDGLWPDSGNLRATVFVAMGLSVGLAMGAIQSASRAFLASVVPPERSGEFFGLYAVAGRFSAIIGPTMFGWISLATGSKSWSVLFLVAMFAGGLALMWGVNEDRARSEMAAAQG